MTSNSGASTRSNSQLLSPEVDEDVSDVESFSRTIPNIHDEDDEEEEERPPDDLAEDVQPGDEPYEDEDEDGDGDDTEVLRLDSLSQATPTAAHFEPSIQESLASSPELSSRNSTLRSNRRSLLPFDRRFSGMLLSSPTPSSQSLSVMYRPSHSRQSSVASTSTAIPNQDDTDTPQPPWEIVRWTKLKKLTGQVFSENGKRNYGKPTVMVVAAHIVVGTSRGLALVFDYHQTLHATIGLGTKAIESGSVTSLAISADHTTIGVGHASGHIFTWEIARPAKPFLHILPLAESQLDKRTADGHIAGSAVVHVGFLGTRHTALVSADNRGMAFSHLATRGFGAMARVVKTARILGRYPTPTAIPNEKQRKASSVLAFASLPLGNVEHPVDAFGLTALLTPYLLVIVSTTPIAETQFKIPRPKEIPPHSTLSGCLAWFPSVKLKHPDPKTKSEISLTKLVYCWSHVLTILNVKVEPAEDKDKPPSLEFQPRSRWRGQEPIVAVQWLTRSVLGVLTISQRLLILEDGTLRVTDSFDLLQKQIYHNDIFSKQLGRVVENLDESDASLHGVVADAFYMSFRTYKGRIFLLGVNDVSIGTLSNWADRLSALLEAGEYIHAIELAETYYSGEGDKLTVGLPDEDRARKVMVKEKLLELLTASLKYVLSPNQEDETLEQTEARFDELAAACFSACVVMNEMDFLFEEVFESFQNASAEDTYTRNLEPYILAEQIVSIPTETLKSMIPYYLSEGKLGQLENVICHLDARMMDINETSTLCKTYHLYDGFIHIWNQAIGDYITPTVELLSIMEGIVDGSEEESGANIWAEKIFPYLACILTGKAYPSGVDAEDDEAFRAKVAMYDFLLSPTWVEWPPQSGTLVKLLSSADGQAGYPYLRLILTYDAPSFLSMLHEAFEDPFLNGASGESSENALNGIRDVHRLPTRQTIINILIEVMGDGKFPNEDSIYLDMFLARNLPKFPQFIGLPGHGLDRLLERLCNYPSPEVADDCQLSVEYLLSFYHPSDVTTLTSQFHKAGFFRVLKSIYKSSKLYAKLLETHFEDPNDRPSVFDCIEDCLRPGNDLTSRQKQEVLNVILARSNELVNINTSRTAQTLQGYAPELLHKVFDVLDKGSSVRYQYLKTLLEDPAAVTSEETDRIHREFDEEYVRLMCAHEPTRVASYIDVIKSGDLRLQEVLPAIEKSGAIDAAVVLLSREGLAKDAMDRLKNQLNTLAIGLVGMINGLEETPDINNTTEAVEDLLASIQKYTKVGVWLCQGQTKMASTNTKIRRRESKKDYFSIESERDLAPDEFLWLELVDAVVQLTTKAASANSNTSDLASELQHILELITTSLRSAVQEAFTALLTSTTRPTLPSSSVAAPPTQPHPSFLIILRAFLTRAAATAPSLSDLRAVLAEIFTAYAFEERILDLANQFLDRDLFESVDDAWERRQKGWRPKGNACEGCSKRVWGPGVGSKVFNSWEDKMNREETQRRQRREKAKEDLAVASAVGSGKGKALSIQTGGQPPNASLPGSGDQESKPVKSRPLVIFACRHIWHKDCLEQAIASEPSQVHSLHSHTSHPRELHCPTEHPETESPQ